MNKNFDLRWKNVTQDDPRDEFLVLKEWFIFIGAVKLIKSIIKKYAMIFYVFKERIKNE